MTNIVPFETGGLPAHLRTANTADLNSDLLAHAGTGFPIISIKGKVFTVKREGEKKVIPNPKDPESPATSIEMVVVKANKGTSKVFYANGYTEGEDIKPDCFSNDGIKPDASAVDPQYKTCAACPKNAWGSKVAENGKKVKACSDSVRIAVSTPDQINDPYFMRVPAASIRNLGEYGKTLAKRGVGYTAVVTKIGFDQESPTPLLKFTPIGFLSAEAFAEVKEIAASDVVQNILGASFADIADISTDEADGLGPTPEHLKQPVEAKSTVKAPVSKPTPPKNATKDKTVTEAEVVAAVNEAVEAKAETKAQVISSDVDIDFDGLDFD